MQGGYSKLTALYLALLLAIVASLGYTPTNDGTAYIDMANTCLRQGEMYPCSALIVGKPFIWNIGIVNLTALSLLIADSVYPLLALFCLLKALTALLMANICGEVINKKAGYVALLLYVIYPNNWGEVTTVNSETPMIFLAMTALYIIIRYKQNLRWLFVGGLIMAFANWFRPIAAIFLLSIIVYWIAFERTNIIRRLAAMLSGTLLTVAFIGLINMYRTGYFIFQADTLWFNMAEATYEKSAEPHYSAEMFPVGTARHIDNMQSKTAIECSRIWRERSLEWLSSHKGEYLSKVPERLYYMWRNDIDNLCFLLADKEDASKNYITLPYRHLLSEFRSLSIAQYVALVNTLLYYLLLLLAVMGTVFLIRKKQWRQLCLPLTIILLGSLMTVLAVHGETRFKLPLMPFVFMLSAVGIISIKKLRLWKR